jgi:hypothetical protein
MTLSAGSSSQEAEDKASRVQRRQFEKVKKKKKLF